MTPERPPEFDACLIQYTPLLHSLARRFVPPEHREEAVQAALYAAIVGWQNFRGNYAPGGGFGAFLKWQFRGAVSNATRGKQLVLGPAADYALENTGVPASQHDALAARQELERIASVPGGEVLIRRAAGQETKEIGAIMGVHRNTVVRLDARARAKLKEAA